MRIALFSDLHLLHWRRIPLADKLTVLAERCKDVDVVLNAGDTAEANSMFDMKSYFPNQEYLEVKGNHDYYGGVFRNEYFTKEIGGYRFFCGTLWTNFNKSPLAEAVAQRSINDFRYIFGGTVETMREAFYDTKKALENYRPHIVMTHFAPFHQCIDPKFGETPLNFFFCNNLKNTLKSQTQIRLWVYGHSHSPMDFELDHRRVVSNPLGYPGEVTFDFDEYQPKIIEV